MDGPNHLGGAFELILVRGHKRFRRTATPAPLRSIFRRTVSSTFEVDVTDRQAYVASSTKTSGRGRDGVQLFDDDADLREGG